MDCDEKRAEIVYCMIQENAGEIVEIGIEVKVDDEGGGKVVEDLMVEVPMVEISMVEVTKDAMFFYPIIHINICSLIR